MAEGMTGRRVDLVLATSTGGVGQHVRSLAAHLAGWGVDVRVLGPAATETLFGFTAVGARFAPVEIASGPRPVADAKAVARLRRLTAATDAVHAHGLRAGLISVLARTRRPTALVVTWHNVVMAGGLRGAVYGGLERVIARGADITLGASQDLVTRALAMGGQDVRLGPVGAPRSAPPTTAPRAVRDELGAGDRPVVLAVGRLHPQKGFDVLVDAAARWTDRDPRPLVVIAGSGPLRAELAARIERTGAPVRLLGHREDVANLMAAADLVVLPSRWEARSLVAQEALRAGRPLIATAVGGLPDLVGNGAELVTPGRVDALDTAVRRLLDDPALAGELAERGLKQAAGWPTEEDTAAQAQAVYAELLGVDSGTG